MRTLRAPDADGGAVRRPWSIALLAVLVALVAGGCELIWRVAQPSLGPIVPLGDIVAAGPVEVPGSGFAIAIPDGWIVEVAPGPGIVSAESGAAWEALRAYAPDGSETCSIYVAVSPEGALRNDGSYGDGIESGDAIREPRLRVVFGSPTFEVPQPRTESTSTLPFSTMGTRPRLAASDPGSPRDVLYALVCGADRERDFDAILGTFRFVPVSATSMAPAVSIVPGSMTNVSLGIFSGRPDPSWTLTEAESAEFGRLLGALPSTVGDPPQGGLGYHGFVVAPADDGQADRTLVAYRGTVADLGSASHTYLVDVDRTVERYLLDTGRSHLSAVEVDAVETDLNTTTGD